MNVKTGHLEWQIAGLKQGDHACLLYETAEEHLAVTISFMRAGLATGERCVYIANDRQAPEIVAALNRSGVDVAREIDRGALKITSEALLGDAVRDALATGFSGVRATGDMTWALGPEVGMDRLIEHEARLNDVFSLNRSLAICQYDRTRLRPAMVRQVLRSHPLVILGDRVCPNLYYEPASAVLGEPIESAQVNWMLEQLKHASQRDEALRFSELHAQPVQAQKMEAIGRLAGGVAHDFNNLLTTILGYNELLEETLPADDVRRNDTEAIRQAGQSAVSLTTQLLAFSRKQVLEVVVMDLNAAVETLDRMLRRLIGEDIHVVTRLHPELGLVRADPGQIEQVILNLAVNARDAMPRGGTLTIETANVELDEHYARGHAGTKPGHYVMLALSDTGQGMDAQTQVHLFEPFFTTKEKGKGTGLGLATVYGIVKQSGGNIWFYSEPEHGTTFKVYLPRAEGVAVPPATPERTVALCTGAETILIVEDNAGLRALTRKLLEQSGYAVLDACNGDEALAICGRDDEKIDLLLTDVVMPGMSGRVLVDRVASQRPKMKVLYTSGYTDDAMAHHGILEEGTAFLQKPYTREVLTQKVREVLDSGE